ncbi:MAG: DUF4369 domain-containing protein [Bacteroidota bacterium]|nr:DUF4369 domain-containing protein [Bacteroidota bacterium]
MMNLKQFYLYQTIGVLLFLFIFSSACWLDTEKKGKISGKILGDYDGTLLLQKIENDSLKTIDRCKLTNNKFEFSEFRLESPRMYYIQLEGREVLISLFAENSDIFVNFDADKPQDVKISGSEIHKKYAMFLEDNNTFKIRLRDLAKQKIPAREYNDTLLMNELDSLRMQIATEEQRFLYRYVYENNRSPVAAYIASESLLNYESYKNLRILVDNFKGEALKSYYYKKFKKQLKLKSRLLPGEKFPGIDKFGFNLKGNSEYVWIILPYFYSEPDTAYFSKWNRIQTKYSDLNILPVLPDSEKKNNRKSKLYPVMKICYLDDEVYENVRKIYNVKKRYTNYLIRKDSLILAVDISIEEFDNLFQEKFHKFENDQ